MAVTLHSPRYSMPCDSYNPPSFIVYRTLRSYNRATSTVRSQNLPMRVGVGGAVHLRVAWSSTAATTSSARATGSRTRSRPTADAGTRPTTTRRTRSPGAGVWPRSSVAGAAVAGAITPAKWRAREEPSGAWPAGSSTASSPGSRVSPYLPAADSFFTPVTSTSPKPTFASRSMIANAVTSASRLIVSVPSVPSSQRMGYKNQSAVRITSSLL